MSTWTNLLMTTTKCTLIAGALLAAGCAVEPGDDLGEGGAGAEERVEERVGEADDAITRAAATGLVPWVVRISVTSPNSYSCSGLMLSEHWILTAAHCTEQQSTGTAVIRYASPTGVGIVAYNGSARFYAHPNYDKPWYGLDSGDDVGLVYLDNGMSLNVTGRARLFTDARRPWDGTYSNRYFHAVGWGRGTDVGGSSDCDDGTIGTKRIGYGFQVLVGGSSDRHVEADRGGTHMCPGDSGGAWLFARGGTDMAFGIVTGYHPLDDNDYASLVVDKFSWITGVSEGRPYRLVCNDEYVDGWRSKRCYETTTPPPPPPPEFCDSGEKCCEPGPSGGCGMCVPLSMSCP